MQLLVCLIILVVTTNVVANSVNGKFTAVFSNEGVYGHLYQTYRAGSGLAEYEFDINLTALNTTCDLSAGINCRNYTKIIFAFLAQSFFRRPYSHRLGP